MRSHLELHHHVFKITLQVLAVAFSLAQTACKVDTKIRDAFYDRTAPDAVTEVQWLDTSENAFTGQYTTQTAIIASWTPSPSTDMTAQKIQFYSDANCTVASGPIITLTDKTTNRQAFTVGADGTFSFKIFSTDRKNNVSESACASAITVDNTPPAVAITVPATSAFINIASDSTNYSVSGTCTEEGQTVTIKKGTGGSATVIGAALCSGGTFNTTVSSLVTTAVDSTALSETAHSITATIADFAANTSTSSAVSVTRDVTAPSNATSLLWRNSADQLITGSRHNDATIKASWTKSASSDVGSQSIQFYADGTCSITTGTVIALSASATTQSFTGADGGIYSYKVTTTDLAGNSTTTGCSGPMEIDTSAPTVTITSAPTWINDANKAAYTVTGACGDQGTGLSGGIVTVTLNDGVTTKTATPACVAGGGGGTYTTTFNTTTATALIDGNNHITVTASVQDSAGNTATASLSNRSRDTSNPTLTLTSASIASWINLSNRATYTVTGTCDDITSGLNGQNITVTITDGTGTTNGTATGTATCTGESGGTGAGATGTFTATIDTTSLADTAVGAATGNISISAQVSDVAGNSTTTAAITRKKDTVAPVLALVAPTTNTAIKGNSAVDVQFNVTEINVDTSVPVVITCTGCTAATYNKTLTAGPLTTATTFTQAINTPNTHSAPVGISMAFSDAAGNPATTVTADYVIDTDIPVVDTLALNSSATTTNNNNVAVALSATDSSSPVAQFCLKYVLFDSPNQPTAPTAPTDTDSCWKNANPPVTNATPGLTISFSNYYHQVGFTKSSYAVYAWVKDQAGNRSTLKASGVGVAGEDRASIYFDPGNPPEISGLTVTNTDQPSNPVPLSEMQFANNGDLYVKWRATDLDTDGPNGDGLVANPISIYYTTNDSIYQPLGGMIDIANNQGADCTVPAGYTGCRKLQAPTSGYFRVRVVAKDATGTTVQYLSPPLNDSRLKILGGNMEVGLGGSASTAILKPWVVTNSSSYFFRKLVVSDDGRVFYMDPNNGLLWINPATGVVNVFIRRTSVSSTDSASGTDVFNANGTINTSVTLNWVDSLALDYQNNLLIYDYDRIRKVDLSTYKITTLVGGGSSFIDGTAPVAANSIKIGFTTADNHATMIPMPNGEIYFAAENPSLKIASEITNTTTQKTSPIERKYVPPVAPATVGTIMAIAYSGGVGMSSLPTEIWNQNPNYFTNGGRISTMSADFAIEYDPNQMNPPITAWLKNFSRGSIGDSVTMMTRIDPAQNYLGVGPYDLSNLNYGTTYTGMNGKIYWMRRGRTQLSLYNPSTNGLEHILGTGANSSHYPLSGPCADGTPKLSCKVNIDQIFVNKAGRVYFMDQGLVRTINDAGNVITLFGQYGSYGGSGVLAQNARIGGMDSAKLDTTVSPRRIVINDSMGNYYRDLTVGGNLSNLTASNYSQYGPFYFVIDSDGNIIATKDSYFIQKFDRSANGGVGAWSNQVGTGVSTGNGTTTFSYYDSNADGKVGSQVALSQYNNSVLGWYGTKIITDRAAWNSGNIACMAKFYDTANSYRQSSFMGQGGNTACSSATMVVGDPVSTSPLGNYSLSNVIYEPNFEPSTNPSTGLTEGKLIFSNKSNKIYKVNPWGNNELLVTLTSTHVVSSLAHSFDANGLSVYYCSGGRIYKWNATQNSGAPQLLTWVASGVSCSNKVIDYDSATNSLYFPVTQNGLFGYAEYLLP